MIVLGSIAIAILTVAFLYWKFRDRLTWWEPLVIIVITVSVAFGSKALVNHMNLMYDEYWGSSVLYLYEEEPWNEWVHQTCTRSYPCGTDSKGNTTYCTETYDCSYQRNNCADWWVVTTSGETISISEARYEEFRRRLGTQHRTDHYHSNHSPSSSSCCESGSKFAGTDVGDVSYVYVTEWDRQYSRTIPVTTKHRYENKIKASDYTVFNYSEVAEEKKAQWKLYDYPAFDGNYFDYNTVLGLDKVRINDPQRFVKEFAKLNGHLGPDKEVKLWLLFFNSSTIESSVWQENYWVGGNKNEVVITVGVDSLSGNIRWADAFSWTKREDCLVKIRDEVNGYKVANDSTMFALVSFLHGEVESSFERRNFDDFNYLTVDPPWWAILIVYIITVLVCVGVSAWVVNNEFGSDDVRDEYGNTFRYRGY